MTETRPPELNLDDKWNKVMDLSLRRVVYSGMAGAIAGLILTSEHGCILIRRVEGPGKQSACV